VGIVADQVRIARKPVGEGGADGARVGYHVAVGEKQAIGRESKATPGAGPALRLLYLDVRHRRSDALRGSDHGAGIGVEQLVIRRPRRVRARRGLALIQQELWRDLHAR
jgi:hypothetical protein